MTLRRPSAVPVAHPIIHPALVVCMCGRGRVCVLAHEDAVWCRGTSCVHQVWTCAGGWRRIYTWEYFFTCLLGFLHFCNCTSSIPQNTVTSDRRPREPDGESRDAPPGARGGVEPGTGYISRSPPRYQENGQLTRGVYRYPTRTTCRVEARRTPHACGCCGRRRTSFELHDPSISVDGSRTARLF